VALFVIVVVVVGGLFSKYKCSRISCRISSHLHQEAYKVSSLQSDSHLSVYQNFSNDHENFTRYSIYPQFLKLVH